MSWRIAISSTRSACRSRRESLVMAYSSVRGGLQHSIMPHVLQEQSRAAAPHCLQEQSRAAAPHRSEEHTSELQSLMRISYAVFCLKKKKNAQQHTIHTTDTNRTQYM